jgi:endonuclease/exonuclease/phosphatase family metal-dependent hydrolase
MPHDGGLHIPNPISWKNEVWKKENSGFIRTHRGEAGISPNRYITWVKLKNRATGKEVVRINTHLISGAFSGKPHGEWRREMWHQHMDRLHDLVARFEKKGVAVVVGGDFNRDSHRVLGNQVAYDNDRFEGTHGKSTLDYLMHVRGPQLRLKGSRVQGDYFSDHDAVIAGYRLR